MLDLFKPLILDLATVLSGVVALAFVPAAREPERGAGTTGGAEPSDGSQNRNRPTVESPRRARPYRTGSATATAASLTGSARLPDAPLPRGAHWSRVAAVVDRATRSAATVRQAQAAALAQLEMAEYALDLLLDEVAAVMPLPQAAARVVPTVADIAVGPAHARRARQPAVAHMRAVRPRAPAGRAGLGAA